MREDQSLKENFEVKKSGRKKIAGLTDWLNLKSTRLAEESIYKKNIFRILSTIENKLVKESLLPYLTWTWMLKIDNIETDDFKIDKRQIGQQQNSWVIWQGHPQYVGQLIQNCLRSQDWFK